MKEIHLKIEPKESFSEAVKRAKEKTRRVQRLADSERVKVLLRKCSQ